MLIVLSGCKANEESKVKAIIGAVLIDGNGGPPITDSVVVVSGSRIRSAGLRANVAIPADADKINGSGKFLLPGLIDTYVKSDTGLVSSGVTTARVMPDIAPVLSDAIFENARKGNVPVTAGVATLAQAQQFVKSGAAGFVGMIGDTEDIDPAFLAKLRALKIVFSPALSSERSDVR